MLQLRVTFLDADLPRGPLLSARFGARPCPRALPANPQELQPPPATTARCTSSPCCIVVYHARACSCACTRPCTGGVRSLSSRRRRCRRRARCRRRRRSRRFRRLLLLLQPDHVLRGPRRCFCNLAGAPRSSLLAPWLLVFTLAGLLFWLLASCFLLFSFLLLFLYSQFTVPCFWLFALFSFRLFACFFVLSCWLFLLFFSSVFCFFCVFTAGFSRLFIKVTLVEYWNSFAKF